MRVFEEECHYPEFGTLTIRDAGDVEEDAGPFEQWGLAGQPCGTIARAGHGWLEGSSGDGPLVVRLEVHDTEPEAESAEWHDVMETPYRSRTGTVGLTTVTCGPGNNDLHLGPAGDYRVRVAAKPLPTSDSLWTLRFWPVDTPTPPFWQRRHTPAVRPADPGWQNLRNSSAADLLTVVSMARDEHGRTSLDSLSRWGEPRFGGPGWLDKPLPQKQNSDLDPTALAHRLGLSEPTSAHDVLTLLVAAGVLDEDNNGYRTHHPTPKPQDVLDLPPPRRAALEAAQDLDRYRSFTSDLLTIALWGGTKQTATALSKRTLTPEFDVQATLSWAHRTDLLTVEGVLTGEFTMTLPT